MAGGGGATDEELGGAGGGTGAAELDGGAGGGTGAAELDGGAGVGAAELDDDDTGDDGPEAPLSTPDRGRLRLEEPTKIVGLSTWIQFWLTVSQTETSLRVNSAVNVAA